MKKRRRWYLARKGRVTSIATKELKLVIFYGHINLNLEVCISNSHVYGTVTLAVIVTVNSGASPLQDNHLALVVRRNQYTTHMYVEHILPSLKTVQRSEVLLKYY
jgi:hypothetical protein